MPTTIATWNVNSLKVRLPHLVDWLSARKPDVMCLQETKLEDESFPRDALAAAGYRCLHAGQKAYNGVAILARGPLEQVCEGIPGFVDEQKRLLVADAGELRVVCAYFPNGQAVGSPKYEYKLAWIAALTGWLEGQLREGRQVVLAGDLNIAPAEQDVYDPQAWAGQVLFSQPEREAFRKLTALGLADSFRLFEQPEKSFSWWDYRMGAFRRNMGLRIDHILVAPPLVPRCARCEIDRAPRRLERPSDHAPVLLELTP